MLAEEGEEGGHVLIVPLGTRGLRPAVATLPRLPRHRLTPPMARSGCRRAGAVGREEPGWMPSHPPGLLGARQLPQVTAARRVLDQLDWVVALKACTR